ncbi:hypothetical protein Tco_0839448 [Tanacetum coccineum]|uniref:Reverse transcriptase domain-containing protein n=1 Tax=Tanacetum coccineum TaxID=301880 RepID=A0ABQ5AQM7_9ASTR
MENTFEISECAETRKVKFATATLHGRALGGILRFNELALLCPNVVPNEKKKVELYIKGLPEIIKGETTSSRPAMLNWENNNQGGSNNRNNNDNCNKNDNRNNNNRNNHGNYRGNNHHNQYNQRRQDGARAMTAAQNNVVDQGGQPQSVIVVVCVILGIVRQTDRRGGNANGHAYALRDAKQDKSFVNSKFSQLIDIKPVTLNISYEVELADGKLVSTNTVLKGCTLNLLNQLFEVDLMPIELGTFDVIIDMDWLVKHDALIVCGKK